MSDPAETAGVGAVVDTPLSIPDFAAKIRKRDARLTPELVDDATLVRKVLERKPELTRYVQTSQPRKPLTRDREPTTEQRTQKFFENHPVIREAALGMASGVGIPESSTPVSDMAKGALTINDPRPKTHDEEVFAGMHPGLLGPYRMAKSVVQQTYGYSQDMFDAVDWGKMIKHPSSFDVFKASKEPAMIPDPDDPKKTIPNPKSGQSIPGTGKEAQFVHGLVGMATMIATALKGAKETPKVAEAVKASAETISSGATDAVQRAAGTDAHSLTDAVTTKAKEATEAENVKIGERNTAAGEKHASAVEKVTDQNAAAEETFKTKIERINQDFGEKVAKAREDHASDVKTRDQKVAELQQKHIADIKQARKEWVEKAHATKTAEAAKESVANRKEVLKRSQQSYVDRIKDNVAHTYATVKGKLDARYEQMRQQPAAVIDEDGNISEMPIKDLPLNSGLIKEAVDKGRKTLQGAPADLKVFNDLVRQMEQGDGSLVDSSEGAEPTLRPLTWDEGRTHYSALGDKLYSGELPGNVAKAIKEVRTGGLDAELQRAAVEGVKNKAGEKGASAIKREYGDLKKDWSQFEDDWRDVGSEGKGASPLARLRLAVDRPVIAGQVMGKFGDRLIETLSKYKESGANPNLFDEARKISREKTSGSVRVSHFPGNVESVPTRVGVPKAPGKLELPEAPKEPPSIPSPEPKVSAIESEQGKRVERATADKPAPKPIPEAPVPEPVKPLPTIDEMVADVKEAKTRRAKKYASEVYKPTKHDAIMISMLGTSLYASGGAGHLGYALTYLPIRYGWTKFFQSQIGMKAMTKITPADIRVMTDILDKVPEERPEAQQAVTAALIDQAKAGKPIPPPATFSKLLDKAQIGAILRVIAPPQPQSDQQQTVQQP